MTHPIPDAALDDRLGFVGTAGSGKTYNSGSAVERLLDKKARVVIPDPLGVWWGLRLMPDGKTPSPYRLPIFGGPHGDLPLNEHAGALIGETVAGMAESCIVDLSDLGTKAAERRFMLAFLTALYRNATGEPVHVVFDEADMWAPQKLMDKDGDAARLLGMMETVVRRGRVKGFIPWLITQRPAVVSKDVLSQVDGLVAFKLTSSQDRDALGSWIEGQADRTQGRTILGSLPTMQRGQGVVWVPARGVLATADFPLKRTFDSSRTPKRGEKKASSGSLAPLDLGALKERLATVETEAKANDPKALKAEIAGLKRQLAAAPTATPDTALLREAETRGYRDGYAQGRFDAWSIAATDLHGLESDIAAHIAGITKGWSNRTISDHPAARKSADVAQRIEHRVPNPKAAGLSPAVRAIPTGDGEKMSAAERKILSALAQYPGGRSKRQVAILTGYAINGGGFNNALSSLRTKGWLEGRGDPLRITEAGLSALGSYEPLPTGPDLLAHWLRQLDKAPRLILEALAGAYPEPMDKTSLAAAAGYEANGGGFNNALSRLRTLELIEGRGELRASDDLF